MSSSALASTQPRRRHNCRWLLAIALTGGLAIVAPAVAGQPQGVIGDASVTPPADVTTQGADSGAGASALAHVFGVLLLIVVGAAVVRLYDVRRQRQLERLVALRTQELTAEIAERRRAAIELE